MAEHMHASDSEHHADGPLREVSQVIQAQKAQKEYRRSPGRDLPRAGPDSAAVGSATRMTEMHGPIEARFATASGDRASGAIVTSSNKYVINKGAI